MRQSPDIVVIDALHDLVHGGVRSTPRAVSIRHQGALQIVLALAGETRHLVAPGEVREMALAAASSFCQQLATLDQCWILVRGGRLGWQCGKVGSQRLDRLVFQFGGVGRHLFRGPQTLPEVNQLGDQKRFGLTGKRRNAFRRGIAVRPVTLLAKHQLTLECGLCLAQRQWHEECHQGGAENRPARACQVA